MVQNFQQRRECKRFHYPRAHSHFKGSQKDAELKVHKINAGENIPWRNLEIGTHSHTCRRARVELGYWQNWYHEVFVTNGSKCCFLYTFVSIANHFCFQIFVFSFWKISFFLFLLKVNINGHRVASSPGCQSCALPLITSFWCSHIRTMLMNLERDRGTEQPFKGVALV